jgi:hypothetical protein
MIHILPESIKKEIIPSYSGYRKPRTFQVSTDSMDCRLFW